MTSTINLTTLRWQACFTDKVLAHSRSASPRSQEIQARRQQEVAFNANSPVLFDHDDRSKYVSHGYDKDSCTPLTRAPALVQGRSSTSRAQAESVAPVAMFVGKDTSRPTSRVPSSTVETATYHQRSTVSDGDTSLQSFYEEHDNIEAGHYDRPKGSPPSDRSDPSDPSSTSSEGSRVSKDSSTSRTARGQSPSHHGIGSQYAGQPGVIAEPGPVSKSLKGLETRKRFRGKDPIQYPSTNNLELTQIGGEVGPVTGHGSSDQQSSSESEQPSHAIGKHIST